MAAVGAFMVDLTRRFSSFGHAALVLMVTGLMCGYILCIACYQQYFMVRSAGKCRRIDLRSPFLVACTLAVFIATYSLIQFILIIGDQTYRITMLFII